MSRQFRLLVFLLGGLGVAVLSVLAFLQMPSFGDAVHLYRDLAVPAAVRHHTANVVSSVNFDQRAFDTLGEETILLCSVVGAAALLRPAGEETERRPARSGHTLEATRLVGYLLMPVTLVLGLDLIAHGHVTPGGGFQGGIVLATGLHLLYVTGSFEALQRVRPQEPFHLADAAGVTGFAALGLAGVVAGSAFLTNVMPWGDFGQLFSAGTVPVLNIAVGLEVAGGAVVLLAKFLEQDITVVAEGNRRDEPLGSA